MLLRVAVIDVAKLVACVFFHFVLALSSCILSLPTLLCLGVGVCRGVAMTKAKPAAKRAVEPAAAPVPAKAAKVDTEQSAPANPASSSSEQTPVLQKPKLPSADGKEKDEPSKQYMKKLVPWVNQELAKVLRSRGVLTATQNLSDLHPLTIDSSTQATSYKEHWVPANCAKAFSHSGLYEAGGSLFWIDPEIASQSYSIPQTEPTWSQVCQVQSEQFGVVRASGSEYVARILFPVPLHTKWSGPVDVTNYPSRLTALGGHAFIYGWYAKMYEALDAGQVELQQLLVQAALTVTVTTWQKMDESMACYQSIKLAETIRLSAKVMTDSFVSFMDKICLANGIGVEVSGSLNQAIVNNLQKENVRFNGGLINVSMVRSINSIRALLTSRARELMCLIERRFGFDVLTGSYNKLRMLATGCTKVGASGMEWCVESMYMSLLRQSLEPADFKNDTFLKGKDGTPSWIAMALAQKQVCHHLQSLAEGVSKVDPALSTILMEKVVAKTGSPLLYNSAFPTSHGGDESDHDAASGAGEEKSPAGDEPDDLVGELGGSACRGAVLLAESYKKLFDGTWDEGLEGLVAHACGETALAELDVDTLKATMAADLKTLMSSLHAAENVVKATGSVPQASLRALVRQHSDGADTKAVETERADVWKRAQTQRRKFVTLATVKDPKKKASYQDIMNKKGGEVAKFQGKAGEEHRLMTLSADLMFQSSDEPWKKPSHPDEHVLEAVCEFLSGCRGVADATVAFDGCMSKSRRDIEDQLMSKLGNYQELCIVYNKSWNECFKKKLVFGSDNVEIGYVSLPGNRSRVEVKERDGGDGSSHFRSMTNADLASRTSLPRISAEDKQKIYADAPDYSNLPKKWRDNIPSGQPLYWQETKTRTFWLRVLEELNVKAVVDVSPGSGSLGVACMEAGVQYFGICQNSVHCTWLCNVLDRAALQYVCESGAHLYQEDLAAHVKELFHDMLKEGEDEENDDAMAMSDDE